jgi:hypothetical protein
MRQVELQPEESRLSSFERAVMGCEGPQIDRPGLGIFVPALHPSCGRVKTGMVRKDAGREAREVAGGLHDMAVGMLDGAAQRLDPAGDPAGRVGLAAEQRELADLLLFLATGKPDRQVVERGEFFGRQAMGRAVPAVVVVLLRLGRMVDQDAEGTTPGGWVAVVGFLPFRQRTEGGFELLHHAGRHTRLFTRPGREIGF